MVCMIFLNIHKFLFEGVHLYILPCYRHRHSNRYRVACDFVATEVGCQSVITQATKMISAFGGFIALLFYYETEI